MGNSLYKYVTIDRLRKILIDRKLRFTQPSAFNDPFELVPLLSVPEDVVPQGHRSYRFDLLSPRRFLDDNHTEINEDRCSDHHSRDLRQALDQELGFLSLSRAWKSLTMWAHYADNYAGAVIEFDGAHEFFNGAFDIQYSSHRPIRDFTLYSNEPIPIAEMCEKSIEWEYEKEVRVARSLSDCQFSRMGSDFPIFVMDVPIECISRVILGERVSQDIAIAIFRLIESNTIRGNRAVVNHWDYNLKLSGFKIGPYKSGGKEINSFVFRNYRHFPSL